MTTTDLSKLKNARPFRPFTIHLADGDQVRVRHPDFIAYADGRTALVGFEDGDFSIVDLLLVTRLSVAEGATAGS